ncbi:hypothetical protein QBA75_37375 [Streptomyces stelliscabiei]
MARTFPDYAFTRIGLYAEVTRRAVLVAWRFSGTHAGTDGVWNSMATTASNWARTG